MNLLFSMLVKKIFNRSVNSYPSIEEFCFVFKGDEHPLKSLTLLMCCLRQIQKTKQWIRTLIVFSSRKLLDKSCAINRRRPK